ncbi:MAG TPA: exodeoxyribonuclease VII large subunit, partial [Burkholderiaceae bacterium]|nr:exodeoxyribonuclease VII large subunit [Burkholderiaceae bacterium]
MTPTTPAVLSVSALNQAVARMLERNFPLTWVAGEISNFTRASSGHWYFTLKDNAAQVRAVMFKGRAQYAGFTPREGDRVEVRALITLYAARGEFQLSVEAIRRAGVGDLYEAFIRLKEKLAAEGLFDAERKRALPRLPRVIGIVTSPQAAALRDILTTLQRRAPHVAVILYPTPVQGVGAAEKIRAAIELAAHRAECDVLLVCRGGGGIEDLWSFNDESVARALVACPMPVVCGIGHETDFTIADFAADLRAPTPTAAAEMAAVPRADW